MNPATLILIVGCILCTWSLLRVFATERQRRMQEMESELANTNAAQELDSESAPPTTSSTPPLNAPAASAPVRRREAA